MTIQDCQDLIRGKRCPRCGHQLTPPNVDYIKDEKYGIMVDDYRVPVTFLVFCPDELCIFVGDLEDFGIPMSALRGYVVN